MGFFTAIGSFIMTPLYYAISAIMLAFHSFFSLFLDEAGGLSWALSIVGLTLVIRILLIPLFVKQIKSQRNMQLLQPKVKELQKKYGHDRQRLGEETMKLYKDAGTNPFASCLPLLLQMPIFFALFRILDQAARNGSGRGFLTDDRAKDFGESQIFGNIPIADSFWGALNGDGSSLVMVVSLVLVLLMTATTFTTQRQLMSKNMPADAMTGPYAQQQKMLLYVLPVAFGLGGVAFPIGVLLYWTTSNLWTMGQQFYVIRNNPAPGTPAFEAKEKRDREKRAKRGEHDDEEGDGGVATLTEDRRPTQREQPKRLTKAERQRAAAKQAALRKEAEAQAAGEPPLPDPEPEPVVEPEPKTAPTPNNVKKTSHPPTKKKKQGGRR